jgi:hypothetical protein
MIGWALADFVVPIKVSAIAPGAVPFSEMLS